MKFGIREISPEHRTANAMPVLKYGMRRHEFADASSGAGAFSFRDD